MDDSSFIAPSAPPELAASPEQQERQRLTRRRWLLGSAAGISALAAGAGGLWWREQNTQADGLVQSLQQQFWGQTFSTPDGAALAMTTFRGRPLLLNFWATWCPPCIHELPLLNRFYNERHAQGWQVLGLAMDKEAAVRQFLARQPLSYPIAMAGANGSQLTRTLGNLQGGLPFTVVLGADGGVLHRKIGQIKEQDLTRWAA